MAADPRLRSVPLFTALSDDDLERICVGVTTRMLAPGEVLFAEGDASDRAYVVVDGEVEITKESGRRTTLLAKRGPGEVIGEMALLQDEPRSATVRAREASELLAIPRSVIDGVLEVSPDAMRSVFTTLLARIRETTGRLRQTERMAQLGTLTAGIAHELNNPAAGARRAAEQLGAAVPDLLGAFRAAADLGGDTLDAVVSAVTTAAPRPMGSLERSDAEADVEAWLDQRGVADGWRLAPRLVDSGFDTGTLDALTATLDTAGATAAVHLLVAAAQPVRLAADVAEGARRIGELVARLKSHAYLDQAAIQSVDVHQGLEDSLMLLAHKLDGITVTREYAEDLPAVVAVGSELNQVWTNLLDNAADAVRSGTDAPRIVVRTARRDDDVVVSVHDNGPGIAPDVRDRIFDAFFTTKPVGSGTGLGLNLSYQIVVFDHHGDLTVESSPGATTFSVTLPISGAATAPSTAAPGPADVRPDRP